MASQIRRPAPISLICCALLLASCSAWRVLPKVQAPTVGSTEGLILVDSPEVYGRERLVVDRQLQKAWLQSKLDLASSAFDAVQGVTSYRALATTSTSLEVAATPQAALAAERSEALSQDLQREQEIEDLEHKIHVAQLEQGLATVLAGGTLDEAAKAPSDQIQPGAVADGSDDSSMLASKDAINKETVDLLPGTKLSEGAPAIKDLPVDRLRDELAYREIVRQELLENDLDDAHDLEGNTLYRLTFDATVIPESETSKWAVVVVELDADQTCTPDDAQSKRRLSELLREWLVAFNETLEYEVRSRTDRYLLGTAEKRKQMALPIPQETPTPAQVKAAVTREVNDEYSAIRTSLELPSKLTFMGSDPAEPQIHASIDATTLNERLEVFCNILGTLPKTVNPYAVTPKESVQRISDTSAFRSGEERALGAALQLGSVGLKTAFNVLRLADAQRQAIQRQPLVVGYSMKTIDQHAVGWFLGPRFRPRHYEPGFDFRHTPSQVPLSAVISVPAWWTNAKMEVTTCWLDRDHGSPAEPCASSTANAVEVEVHLPGDPTEITNALFPRARRPQPFFYGVPDFEIGRKEALVIYGDNLWRNPTVMLGNQAASSVALLPDMKGLLATFDKVASPAGLKTNPLPRVVEVWVWTSEDREIAGSVRLHEASKSSGAASPAPAFKAKFALTSEAGYIVESAGKGIVGLRIKFDQKDKKNEIETACLDTEGGVFDMSTPDAQCLDKTKIPLELSGSCRIELRLLNLKKDQTVALKSFHLASGKKGCGKSSDKKVDHAAIKLVVR